jgi:GntP family gluconate:H+ symporter
LLALLVPKKWTKNELGKLMNQGIDKAGGILVIIGAGAAFGAIIGALKIQDHLAGIEILNTMGLLFPFLVTAILKTAQGSSTVAIVTAASIVLPFLSGLGLDSDNGRILAVLAMGAGSMAVSHVNDSYFWVIANFADLELKPMLRVFTVASLLMAVAGFLAVYVLSLFLL